jgi:Fe-S-cluster containining protein
MSDDSRDVSRRAAESLKTLQRKEFPRVDGLPDKPGARDEAQFSARVTRVSRTGPACPLLEGDLCGVYADRPLLCRAYGFPVDAYAVRSEATIVFRSLCHLYEGMETADYVRAEDLKRRVREVSRRLGGGRDWGRFTSAEAILARVDYTDSRADRDGVRAAEVH